MTQNKTTKYFKYAIGEIILVVIGILIALGINNWNENRKAEEKTNQFLVSLKSDLQNDLNEINTVNKEQQLRFNALNKVIELSEDPNIEINLKKDTLKTYKAGKNVTFFPVVGSYKAASNAGLIDNIKDEDLKRSILNLYEHLYVRINYNAEINDMRTSDVDWESRLYIVNSKKEFVFDKIAILDKDFISQIGYLNRFIGFYLMRCNDTKAGIKEALAKIDNYINSYD